jgi:hypothetical protein
VRLGFSVAIQVDAEILLVDEVLAVGDVSFQQKCFEQFHKLKDEGRTIVLVTHDMGAVERFCDRAMLLENGRVVDIGETERVGARYFELNFSPAARQVEEDAAQAAGVDPVSDDAPIVLASVASADLQEPGETAAPARAEEERTRFGNGKAELTDGWFEDADGTRTSLLRMGEKAAFCLRAVFHERVEDPLFGVSIYNTLGDCVLGFNNRLLGPSGTFEPGQTLELRIAFDNVLIPGRYAASPAIAHSGGGFQWIDHRKRWLDVVVTGTGQATGALVELPFEMSIR